MDPITKYIKVNSMHVVGVFRNSTGNEYRLLTVRKRKGKLSILNSTAHSTLELLFEKAGSKLPVILVFEGKGILEKEIDLTVDADKSWYNSIDFESILYTAIRSQKSTFISFCRKNIVDEVVEEFKNRRLYVLDVYIGSFMGALLQKELHQSEIVSHTAQLSFESGNLSGFSKYQGAPKRYKIGDDEFTSEVLPLYGALVHYIVKQDEVSKTSDNSYCSDEALYRKLFDSAAVAVLVFFFISLLASFTGIQYFGSKNAELVAQNLYSGKAYEFLSDLQGQRKEKLEVLNQTGLMTSKFLSFYAYEMTRTAPAGLSLTQLAVSPSALEIRDGKQAEILSKTIAVKGKTSAQVTIDKWIGILTKMSWLENVEIVSVERDKTGLTTFEIKIGIKNV
jgi:hypothetical protein